MNRTELQQMAAIRLADAEALLAATPSRPDGAYYLAGYAVECALKAAIAKLFRQDDWPDKKFVSDCYTHDLVKLLRLADLGSDFANHSLQDKLFEQNWNIVKDWDEQSRYQTHSLVEAGRLVSVINDENHGVLTWIMSHW